jgi:hypothetical protein
MTTKDDYMKHLDHIKELIADVAKDVKGIEARMSQMHMAKFNELNRVKQEEDDQKALNRLVADYGILTILDRMSPSYRSPAEVDLDSTLEDMDL